MAQERDQQQENAQNQKNKEIYAKAEFNLAKVTFRWGLTFGFSLAIIGAVVLLIGTFLLNSSPSILILSSTMFLLGLAAYFTAGLLTSRRTGLVYTGTVAGLLTGTIYGLINLLVNLTLFFTINLPRAMAALDISAGSLEESRTFLIAGAVGGALFGLLLAIGLGAGVGALGGLLGRSRWRKTVFSHLPPYYPPYPHPGSPAASQSAPAVSHPSNGARQGDALPIVDYTDPASYADRPASQPLSSSQSQQSSQSQPQEQSRESSPASPDTDSIQPRGDEPHYEQPY
ncbi:MAG: hypothetical protein IMW89_20230 [Ktedonobacteraceae bacterium]|nr:hypothetical protein [Ktedonobacteraceae bacterium]